MDLVELAHLLRRTEYVAKADRMTALASATRAEAVADVLAVPADPVVLPAFIDHDISGQRYDQWAFAVQWWLDRMTDVARPMQERMAFFWHGHFCSSWDKVNRAPAMMAQNQLFRSQGLGNFRALTQVMAVQPAMLYYLDNVQNVASSPNQNFARELMELFTLGVGNYTEADVTAAARAWTGHTIDEVTEEYVFVAANHDIGPTTFMGVTRNWDGPGIIDHLLLENTTTKLVACRFLTRKLWEHFGCQNPSVSLVNELAQVLFDHEMEMLPWVTAMLMHDEFYTSATRQGLVRSPVEFVVALQHHTGLRGADLNPQWYVEGMGQVPFAPPNVAGWKTNAYWTNSSLFGGRAEFARDITWKLRHNDANAIAKNHTPAEAVAALESMFGLTFTTATRQALLGYIAVQRTNEPWIGWWESTNLLTMAMMTPEMHLA